MTQELTVALAQLSDAFCRPRCVTTVCIRVYVCMRQRKRAGVTRERETEREREYSCVELVKRRDENDK